MAHASMHRYEAREGFLGLKFGKVWVREKMSMVGSQVDCWGKHDISTLLHTMKTIMDGMRRKGPSFQ